jgi:intracellular multiplication protein IcmT
MTYDVLWRDTAISPKIFILDARAVFPLALWLFHWAWWTFFMAVACMVVLHLVQRTGMTPMACLRALRVAIIGTRRETRVNEMQWRKRCRW